MRVLHLAGSPVDDFHADLSRLYAADCLAAVGDADAVVAWVSPDGSWRFPSDLARAAIEAAPPMSLADALPRLAEADVMVPQMFCRPGMTHYRALFDVLGVPYVGNTPEAMALTAHKDRARGVVAAAGVAVPEGELLWPGEAPTLAPPVVVKPADGDNSRGIALVRSADDFPAALDAAFGLSDEVLVERYVELGREVRCATLERDGELVCLPLEEYRVDDVRTADDKLRRDDGELALVAKVSTEAWILDPSDPITAPVHAAARRCHVALGCRDYGLFDFRIDPDGRPWFLEAGLYCSFARQSVIPMMAAAAGIALSDLFATALDAAVGRSDID